MHGLNLTERRNLRGGAPSWLAGGDDRIAADPFPDHDVEIAIVGAGVMGAMLADRLTADGRDIALLDRRPPAHGSTAASTALVMWGADVPLTQLAKEIGMDEAARRWRRVFTAQQALAERIDTLGLDCSRRDRPELYLAGTLLDEAALELEGEARRIAGLPSEFMPVAAVAERFGIAPRAALLSAGSYGVDPVALTLGLLERARERGARICFPVDVTALEQRADGVTLVADDGNQLRAGHVILAPGYERPRWFLPPAFSIVSSYAVATAPATAPLWRENALIWEASDPYLYTRATAEGRVIAGGEDEEFEDGEQRDALIETKRGIIAAKLAALLDVEHVAIDHAWSAAFGSSPDGLPAIGRAANAERIWLASGFGGNGVTFAALAAELIGAAFAGAPDTHAGCFDPYRFSG